MGGGHLDLMKGMGCGNENLLGRTSAVWAGAAEIPFLDEAIFFPAS
jgi:hypothetical protein